MVPLVYRDQLSPVLTPRHKATAGADPGCIAALGGNPFDQARVVILDVADPGAHGPAGHLVRWKRREQSFQRGRIRRLLSEPDRPDFGLEYHRHAVVKFST